MNALIKSQKQIIGINNYHRSLRNYSITTEKLWTHKTRKCKVNEIFINKFNEQHLRHLSTTTYLNGANLSTTGSSSSSSSFLLFRDDYFLNNHYENIRHFSLGRPNFEQHSSKVEETVKTIKEKEKEKIKEKEKEQQQLNEIQATISQIQQPQQQQTMATAEQISSASQENIVGTPSKDAVSTNVVTAPTTTVAIKKKPIRQRIWEELLHYYHGFRLLFIDINICRKLIWQVLNGDTLSRREHRLLIRTTSDLFRLLPFSVFIIVPFMELLLPVAIKLFPGMLPSTFQTAKDNEDKFKQSLKVKLEMAKFLQKTLDEMTVQAKDHKSEAAKEFTEFFVKMRTSGTPATNDEIMKFSKLFEDEITLDSLSRQQLTALCRVLETGTIGTNNFLRFQLRMKLRSLAADDRMIQKEGIESLTLSELQAACRSRGMRAYGISEERLKIQLQEWINLSLNEKVPPSLLLLSRALMLPEHAATTDKLKATISSLPDTIVTQTKAAIGEREGKIDNKTKIEIIREEQRKIKEEKEEQKEIDKEKIQIAEELIDKAPIITASEHLKTDKLADVKPIMIVEDEISSKDLEVLGDALDTLSKDTKTLIVEKEEIKDLKEEIAEYQEDVQELHEVVTAAPEKVEIKESKAAKNLFKKVNSMISKLENELDKEEKKIKTVQGITPETEAAEIQDQLVHIDELIRAVQQIQKVPDESRLDQIQKILGKIDVDQDGKIRVEDVLKVIETIGKENVKLNSKQVDELIELMTKEEILENDEKIEKALAKEEKIKQKEAQEKLIDTAKVINENPLEEINLKKEKDITIDENLKDEKQKLESLNQKTIIDPDVVKKAIENQNEKILSTDTTTMPQPPPQIPTSGDIKPKDKML